MKAASRISKSLSWLLRHGANEKGLPMDAAGWVPIEAVLEAAQLDRKTLLAVVATNDKQRLAVKGGRIRATQGHSLAGTPVTLEALEASWARIEGRTERLWHGTRADLVDRLRSEGLKPMDRTHVHLAGGVDDRVGKRHQVDLLLAVDPVVLARNGVPLFQSENGVFLVRYVPPDCIVW